MIINKEQNQDALTLSPEGRLDTITAPELEGVIRDIPAEIKHLKLDLKKLDYISSAGLRVLLAAQKKLSAAGGEMTISNVNETIAEIFEVTGFSDILTIV